MRAGVVRLFVRVCVRACLERVRETNDWNVFKSNCSIKLKEKKMVNI